jgi:hypothetical protein
MIQRIKADPRISQALVHDNTVYHCCPNWPEFAELTAVFPG